MTLISLTAAEWFHTSWGEVGQIAVLSLVVSTTAVLIAGALALPLAARLGLGDFPGRRLIMRITYTLISLPPVLAGLLVYLLLSRSGPLGAMGLLFTPAAMVIAQVVLATPIITGLAASAIATKRAAVLDTALTLGASPRQAAVVIMKESRREIGAAVLTAFGRVFGEVGAVMLVGGNIRFSTRVLTTAIVLETRQGNTDTALALGGLLLVISFVISSIVMRTGGESKELK